MRFWEFVGSAAEAVKRHAPDATPAKNACTTAFTKVKTACTNSYDCGSAALAKIDHTVRTVRLRRRASGGDNRGAYENIPGEEVEEREGVIVTPLKANGGGPVKSVTYSYAFLTFAKVGYTVRVKVVYRIVQWISDDGTKSSVTIYSTNLAHESDDGDKFILGDQDTEKNESKNFFDTTTTTFAKMVDSIKESMSSPTTKSRIIIYTAILGENVRIYGLQRGLTLSGDTFFTILIKTLIDIAVDLVIEKADSREQHSIKGSREFIPGVEMDDKWYSYVLKFLNEKAGIIALRDFLIFVVKEFSAFLRMEAFRAQCFSKGVFTVEYLVPMMGKFLEFVKKRHCDAGFFIIQAIVMAAMRNLRCAQFVNEWGFHGSATKGNNKKKNMKKKK